MLKRLLICMILLFSLAASAEADRRVAVVLSAHNRVFETAIDGFNSASYFTTREFSLKKINRENITQLIRKYRADVILAMGKDALSSVSKIDDIPVLFMFIPQPESYASKTNFYGTGMHVDPVIQLTTMQETLPTLKHPGIIYSSQTPELFISRFQTHAQKNNLLPVLNRIGSPSEFPDTLNAMAQDIDYFIMIPDRQVITSQTLEFLMLFSIKNKIPVISFSEKYLDLGAVMSITPDIYEMGRQTGKMADLIISDSYADSRFRFTEKPAVTINRTALGNMGIELEDN